MSKLSEALAAMDKATPGPWGKPYYDNYPGDRGWWIHNGVEGAHEYAVALTFYGNPKAEYDIKLIAAAPDALAWIKEALPYITEYRDTLATNLENCDFGPHEEGAARKELARLDALIARAKPEEVGR